MLVRVYKNFVKKHNSTKLPNTAYVDVAVLLKDSCSMLAPEIEIQGTIDFQWNYAYIPDFSRYYYINDITYYRGVYTLSLVYDPLASWKNEIRNTTAKVLYCSTYGYNDLNDSRNAARGEFDRQITEAVFDGALSGQQISPSGTFLLTALSKTSVYSTGVMTTYFMTYQEMQKLAEGLVNPAAFEQLKQYFTNPMDAIVECAYIPLDLSSYIDLSSSVTVQIGDYTVNGCTARVPLATDLAVKSHSATIEIDWYHKIKNGYSDYRNMSPYTTLELFVPFCGSKQISTEMIYNLEALFVDYSVDVMSGNVQAIVWNKGTVIQEFSGNCKIICPIGQTQSRIDQVSGIATGIASTAIGIGTGNAVMTVSGLITAINSVTKPAVHNMMGGMSGSSLGAVLGNDVMRWQRFKLSRTTSISSDEPERIREYLGLPFNRTHVLLDFTGYVQTSGASVIMGGTDREKQDVNSLLDSGIYIE